MHPQRSSIEIYLRSEVPRHVAILMNGRGVGPIGIYLQIFAPKLQLLFHLLYPHLNDGKGPIQGHDGQLICPPQMGVWPKYASNALAPGLQSF